MEPSTLVQLDRLVFRYQNGDTGAEDAIIGLLWDPVCSSFHAHNVDPMDVQVVVSEFFSALFTKKILSYAPQPGTSFWSWLTEVIRNHSKDLHRAIKRRRKVEAEGSDYIQEQDVRSVLRSAFLAQRPRLTRRMIGTLRRYKTAFGQLSAVERDLLLLREVEGLSYVEISAILAPALDEEARIRQANSLRIKNFRAKKKIQRWMETEQQTALTKLRQQRVQFGFVAFPVWEYLRDLANQAKISLGSVLAPFGLDSKQPMRARTAPRIASILACLGCPLEEALQMMRLSFAEEHGFSVKAELALARRGGTHTDESEVCERALGHAEVMYSLECSSELEGVIAKAVQEYSAR
jgi:RNA polymerase sigma factor (sigma-70 family)